MKIIDRQTLAIELIKSEIMVFKLISTLNELDIIADHYRPDLTTPLFQVLGLDSLTQRQEDELIYFYRMQLDLATRIKFTKSHEQLDNFSSTLFRQLMMKKQPWSAGKKPVAENAYSREFITAIIKADLMFWKLLRGFEHMKLDADSYCPGLGSLVFKMFGFNPDDEGEEEAFYLYIDELSYSSRIDFVSDHQELDRFAERMYDLIALQFNRLYVNKTIALVTDNATVKESA